MPSGRKNVSMVELDYSINEYDNRRLVKDEQLFTHNTSGIVALRPESQSLFNPLFH